MHIFYKAAFVFLCFASSAIAQTPTFKNCSAIEYRQFDFWIGEWNVFDRQGKKVGDSRIELINDGCALLENWTGAGGVTGKSLNIYDVGDKHWHQFWVDSGAERLVLDGMFSDGKMILQSRSRDPKHANISIVQKITWSHDADGSVRQLWEKSTDSGKTWSVEFDGKYVKKISREK